MNHTITLGGLAGGLAILIGLALLAAGTLALFASGMSDNQSATASAEKTGCRIGAAGIVLLIIGIVCLI